MTIFLHINGMRYNPAEFNDFLIFFYGPIVVYCGYGVIRLRNI